MLIGTFVVYPYMISICRRFEINLPNWLFVPAMLAGAVRGLIPLVIYGTWAWDWAPRRIVVAANDLGFNSATMVHNVFAIVVMIQLRRKIMVATEHRCLGCGYQIRHETDICPECGQDLSSYHQRAALT